jgi:hypothetical protein
LAAAQRQGPHDNNINQKYSGIGYYRIKRLWGQQHDSSGGGVGGSLAAAAAAAAWRQRGVRGRRMITSIKILRVSVLQRGQQRNMVAAAATAAWRWQWQLDSNVASGAARQQHQSKILRDRESQNHKTAGAAARQRWQQQRQLGSGSSNLAAARHQGPHDNNINQKYSGIGNYRIKRLVLEANVSFKDKPR